MRQLIRRLDLAAVYRKPRTSVPHPDHAEEFPYLLRDMSIDRANQVWCADITYIPMRRWFLYLVAVMDWASRKMLSRRVPNTMDVDFCIAAEALARFGRPEISNTDQGCLFTSPRFVEVAQRAGALVSMDGRGRWLDNVIERLWRSLRVQCVCLRAFQTASDLRSELTGWVGLYHALRPLSARAGRTPDEGDVRYAVCSR